MNRHDESSIGSKRAALVEAVRKLRDGRVDLAEAAPLIAGLRSALDSTWDEDLRLFVAITSQSDHILIGEARRYYSPEALAKAEAEIKALDQFYRADVLQACDRLLARFAHSSEEG